MRIHERLSPYAEALLRLIYPAACALCATELELEEHGICRACATRLQEQRFDFQTSCLEAPLEFIRETWVLYPYESPVKELLTSIKFSKKRWLIQTFAQDLIPFAQALASVNHYDMLVPIPLDGARLRERHFNQAELFAGLLSKALKNPVQKLLHKRYSTPAQSRLSQKERGVNLFQAFRVSHPQRIQGKTILLVDDVLTTGTTVREAARVLKKKGAKRVDAFALACTSRTL